MFDWGPLLAEGPLFIGILNLTPDSFSDGGCYTDVPAALAQARRLQAQGCRMLDLGAESTRPGASPVAPSEEWQRLEPVLLKLRSEFPALPLSVDSRHAGVAERALACGARVLNDVTGFRDPAMLSLARDTGCGLIAMRSRVRDGRLWMPDYGAPASGLDTTSEMAEILERHRLAGIRECRILLDPGFGFGTTFEEDLALWERLPRLQSLLGWPSGRLCLGLSRKRFVAWKSGRPELPAAERDAPTAALHSEAFGMGIRVFRTHAAHPLP